ncbi:photosynthetic NDH subunit of subcomplex B 3, chloroplastic isoform X2 [Tripterygium wilfordii]|uniref:photosynthetic NDH subunit of subcomplex B 3, chloroplastic isoform X2 n=1 Tax=Tripterygium wilfordii TaxID=458696 RepID=UPI0018F84122|nr:photosynthetic NDH subunit of subcomplex B 3, chloroplastic isoform X2 [Tripterygium wilfordii]
MAAINLAGISLQPPNFFSADGTRRNRIKFLRKKRSISASVVSCSPESSATDPEKPEIELEFVGPKPESHGKYSVERAKAVSGEKLLRNIMLDNKIELYAAYILDGKDLLNERTNTELRYIKKKPESWRLACQTIVGNKENSGKVVVQRLPQWKK